jgi:hypothetical protein
MITDEFPCESVDNDYRGLLGAYQMDNMEYPPNPEGEELDIWRESNRDDEPTCIHGLSEWLCMGPNHYPSRQDEMEGRYF